MKLKKVLKIIENSDLAPDKIVLLRRIAIERYEQNERRVHQVQIFAVVVFLSVAALTTYIYFLGSGSLVSGLIRVALASPIAVAGYWFVFLRKS